MGAEMDTMQREKPKGMIALHRIVARAPNRPEPILCQPSREAVARRAYEIWQQHGCPPDSAFHDWLAAEAELRCPPHIRVIGHPYWNGQMSKHDPREL